MEAILRSVLLRQEQMAMQWDAEFEQQKQLFHINTSTLIDMLPIQSRKKRFKIEDHVQPGPTPSHDKENVLGYQGLLPNTGSLKSPKTKAPYSRGLARRDLNTRFCDNVVKEAGRIVTKSAIRNCLDVDNLQENARIVHGVRATSQGTSLQLSVKVEADERDFPKIQVSPRADVVPASSGENRKRIREEEKEEIVSQHCNEQNQELSNDPEEVRQQAHQLAMVDLAEKKTKPKRARKVGKANEYAVEVEEKVRITGTDAQVMKAIEPEIVSKVEMDEQVQIICRDAQVVKAIEPEIVSKVEMDEQVQIICRDAQVVKAIEPEIVSKVEVEDQVQITYREAQVMKAEIEPEIVSKGPTRRGRLKGATVVTRAAVSKEPVRRGRAKQVSTVSEASVPQIAPRVTRSRTRMAEGVVESESGICAPLHTSEVANKKSAQVKGKAAVILPPRTEDSSVRVVNSDLKQGDSVSHCEIEGQNRSSNDMIRIRTEAFSKPDVSAPLEQIMPDGPSSRKASHSKVESSVFRLAQKDSENGFVALDMETAGHVNVSSHVDSHGEAVPPRTGPDEWSVRVSSRVVASMRINSRVAEILADVGNLPVDYLKDDQNESQLQPQLESIEECIMHREAEYLLASRSEGTAQLRDGSDPMALVDAEEEFAKNASCLATLEDNTSPEVIFEDMAKGGAPMQSKMTTDDGHASNNEAQRLPSQRLSSREAAELPLRIDPTMISGMTSIKEVYACTALLSEAIEGNASQMGKLGDPASPPESLIVTKSDKCSLQSARIASVTIPLELPEAGKDASASEVHVLPTYSTVRKSTVSDFTVVWRDGTREHPAGDLNILASDEQATESDNVIEECSIEANILFAERSWHSKRESMPDVVMNTLSEGFRVKEPNDTRQSNGGASRMDVTREQVKSDVVSPVRYSEARAIEEAMGCSLEQEFHPDVTLTLNRFQFRKRLSPRSKARARRWRSDVATNGVDYGTGQSLDAPLASPSRVVSCRDRSLEGVAYETFLEAQSPNPEAPFQGFEQAFSFGAEKAAVQADTISRQENSFQPERCGKRSIESLCNEVLSQTLQDGEVGDNTVEYEIMETADENGNVSPLPLLQSIYKLSKACQNDMVGARGFLEEEEEQQVHSLIESAKKIMEQLSNKRALAMGAQPKTLASPFPAPNNSRFYDHTNLYPDRFRLFNTPVASSAAPPIFPSCSSIFPISATQEVASSPPDDIEVTSPHMKHLHQETVEQAGSKPLHLDLALSESAIRADDGASPARSRSCSLVNDGKLLTTSCSGTICQTEEGVSFPLVGSGFERFTLSDPVHFHIASDEQPKNSVGGKSTIGSASRLLRSQDEGVLESCDGNVQLTGALIGTVDTVGLVTHQSEGPLGLETILETEELSELRSRFYALSKDYVAGTSSAAKDVLNLLGAGSESFFSHATIPPSPTPSLRFSPGHASKEQKFVPVSVKRISRLSKDVPSKSGEFEEPDACLEGATEIPCSTIFIEKQHGQGNSHQGLGTMTDMASFSHHGFQKTVIISEEAVIPEGTSEHSEEPVTLSQSIAAVPMLRVEPQSTISSRLSSNPNLPPLNLVSSIRSFIPLVQQQQPSVPYLNGKRDVKVKALEAAEAAKRLAEQKELEKQERKKVAELAKREKLERAAQEKLAKREQAAQEKMKQQEARAEEASKRKAVAAGTTKSVLADSTNYQGANSQNVLVKVKKTHEMKLKMDQDKQERLLEEQRRKEEEWKKKEAENAARKRKHEAAEKKDREEKRRRQEEAVKVHREMEERQRLELEKKTQKQRALEEMEKERKAIEEELKRQKRLAKEKEVEQRRKKEEEKELAWLDMKEATRKRKEEAAKQMKLLESEGRQQAVKIRRPSEDPAITATGPYHSFMASLHVSKGLGEGVGAAQLSGVNNLVDPQRPSSQSLIGHSLRVPQQSAEGAGASCRNSQTAIRVPRTTPDSAHRVSNMIVGSGQPLFPTPPEALGNIAVASSIAVSNAIASTALRDRIIIPQDQSSSKTRDTAMAGGGKPCKPGQVGFAGPPGGVIKQGVKGLQSYEISPYRDSEDEDEEEEEKRSQKPIPQWARKENMLPQLVRQLEQDPDDIFVGASSCSLDEVFEVKGSKKRPNFKRRGSSGDWAKDCLTWQEQIQYKVTMGYLH